MRRLSHKEYMTKYFGSDDVYLDEVARIQTGLVTTRKMKNDSGSKTIEYNLLNLKCISESGEINTAHTEKFLLSTSLKSHYLSQKNDILLRLSAPYTAVFIEREEHCGYVIPSHFAIIRVDSVRTNPQYIYWILCQKKTQSVFFQNSSGSTVLGNINVGLISKLQIRDLPLLQQNYIGEIARLERREQELLQMLAEEKKRYSTYLLNSIYEESKERKE